MTHLKFFKQQQYHDRIFEELPELIHEYAVVHLKDVPDLKDQESFYAKMANNIGYFINKDEDPQSSKISHSWTDIRFIPERSNQAFKHSNLRQPLHTDYCHVPFSFDVTFFFCKEQAPYGGATTFIDPQLIVNLLQEYQPELYGELTTREVLLGRGDAYWSNNNVKILDFDEEGPVFNWNYYRVKDSNSHETLQMAEEFHYFLEQIIIGGGLTTPVKLQQGEGVFIRDTRVLHGRDAFLGNRHLCKGAIAIYNIDETKRAVESL